MSLRLDAYSLLLFVAIHVGVFLTERRLRRDGESLVARPWLLLALLVIALAGGRVHYVVEALVRGAIAPDEVLAWLSPTRGGSTFFGSMAGLFLGLLAFRRHLPYGSLLRLADAGVPGLAAGIAIGRIGCLANGCCLGRPTAVPWAADVARHAHDPDVAEALARMSSADGSTGLHPLVIYLGLWALVAGWVATRRALLERLGGAPGLSFLLFAWLFSAGRFLLERFRLPPGGDLPGFNAARWESLLLVLALTVALAIRARAGAAARGRPGAGDEIISG